MSEMASAHEPIDGGSARDMQDGRIAFFSFGMFIIDEIEYLTPQPTTHPPSSPSTTTKSTLDRPPKTNLPGGAGLYALLGARLLTPPPFSQQLSWILDAGHDLPPSSPVLHQLRSWNTSTIFRRDDTRATTRAWNGYGHPTTASSPADPDHRSFKYLTPKRRLDVPDLSPAQLTSRAWHMVCSPTRCVDILTQLTGRPPSAVVWEPIPDLCTPAELHNLQHALTHGVDVVSPNADELALFFDVRRGQHDMVRVFMGWDENDDDGVRGSEVQQHQPVSCVCVVREGRDGSTVYFPPNRGIHARVHLPAYHDGSSPEMVVDPTGGGNTYLGAYAVVLGYLVSLEGGPVPPAVERVWRVVAGALGMETRIGSGLTVVDVEMARHVTAAVCACVAAGFAIEQTGVPVLGTAESGSAGLRDGVREVWNGETVMQRVDRYLEREWKGIEHQLNELRRGAEDRDT